MFSRTPIYASKMNFQTSGHKIFRNPRSVIMWIMRFAQIFSHSWLKKTGRERERHKKQMCIHVCLQNGRMNDKSMPPEWDIYVFFFFKISKSEDIFSKSRKTQKSKKTRKYRKSRKSQNIENLKIWKSRKYRKSRKSQKFQKTLIFHNFFSFASITNPLTVFLDGLKQLYCEILSTNWFNHKQRNADMVGLPYDKNAMVFLKNRKSTKKRLKLT